VSSQKPKQKRWKKKRRSTLYQNPSCFRPNLTSDQSESQSYVNTEESKGNILVEEDSFDTYDSNGTMAKAI
jgi:hypothetical protein